MCGGRREDDHSACRQTVRLDEINEKLDALLQKSPDWIAEITGQRVNDDGPPFPMHECDGGFTLVRFGPGLWAISGFDGDGNLVFCPTCGKRLPLEA